jgi:hypothetical protein
MKLFISKYSSKNVHKFEQATSTSESASSKEGSRIQSKQIQRAIIFGKLSKGRKVKKHRYL